MLKIIAIRAAAALVVCPFSLTPAVLSSIDTATPPDASRAAANADRLDVGARGAACSQRAWPYYDSACLYDGMRPAGEVREVRVVPIDHFSIAE
jgi:hypothetical protein